MKCEDCGFDLLESWSYCPECGESAPESETEKAERKAKHEARLLADPAYKASMDRMAEHHKMMRPLLDAQWAHHLKAFSEDSFPAAINQIKDAP